MKKKFLIAGIIVIFLIGVFAVYKIVFPIDVYVNRGVHMEPALRDGDKVLLEKSTSYARGDIVVFKNPEGSKYQYVIQRIVGLPNETIEIKNGDVLANNQILTEPYAQDKTSPAQSVTLNNDQYYVLGDNRLKSADSRLFGPITSGSIIGRVNNVAK